jgi:hypothetical protein
MPGIPRPNVKIYPFYPIVKKIIEDGEELTVTKYENGRIEILNKDGLYHCRSMPALVVDNDLIKYEEWFVNGRRHRDTGPALTMFRSGGKNSKYSPEYYIQDIKYSEKEFHEKQSGKIFKTEVDPGRIEWQNSYGHLHRLDGPAIEYKNHKIHGNLSLYFIDGYPYSVQAFNDMINNIKLIEDNKIIHERIQKAEVDIALSNDDDKENNKLILKLYELAETCHKVYTCQISTTGDVAGDRRMKMEEILTELCSSLSPQTFENIYDQLTTGPKCYEEDLSVFNKEHLVLNIKSLYKNVKSTHAKDAINAAIYKYIVGLSSERFALFYSSLVRKWSDPATKDNIHPVDVFDAYTEALSDKRMIKVNALHDYRKNRDSKKKTVSAGDPITFGSVVAGTVVENTFPSATIVGTNINMKDSHIIYESEKNIINTNNEIEKIKEELKVLKEENLKRKNDHFYLMAKFEPALDCHENNIGQLVGDISQQTDNIEKLKIGSEVSKQEISNALNNIRGQINDLRDEVGAITEKQEANEETLEQWRARRKNALDALEQEAKEIDYPGVKSKALSKNLRELALNHLTSIGNIYKNCLLADEDKVKLINHEVELYNNYFSRFSKENNTIFFKGRAVGATTDPAILKGFDSDEAAIYLEESIKRLEEFNEAFKKHMEFVSKNKEKDLTIVKIPGTPTTEDLDTWREIFEDAVADPDFKIFSHPGVEVTQVKPIELQKTSLETLKKFAKEMKTPIFTAQQQQKINSTSESIDKRTLDFIDHNSIIQKDELSKSKFEPMQFNNLKLPPYKNIKPKQQSNSKKEKKMSNDMSFTEIFAQDAAQAAVRSGTTLGINAIKSGIEKALTHEGMKNEGVKAVMEFLSSDIGEALIRFSLGHGLMHIPIPQIKENEYAQQVSEELRVSGLSKGMDKGAEVLQKFIVPQLMEAYKDTPLLEKVMSGKKTKLRVEHKDESEELEEDVKLDELNKSMSASV